MKLMVTRTQKLPVAVVFAMFLLSFAGEGCETEPETSLPTSQTGTAGAGATASTNNSGGTELDGGLDASGGLDGGSDADAEAGAGLVVTVDAITSSTVSLSWPLVDGASQIRIYLGAEPPEIAGDALPDQVLVATLDGTLTSHQLTGLAPAVHHFLRVVIDTASEAVAGNAHARTTGGPGPNSSNYELDNQVREVLGVAPTILAVVITQTDVWVNDDPSWEDRRPLAEAIAGVSFDDLAGDTYQTGPWTVTRLTDQSSIAVNDVHRRSLPVGTPRGVHVIGVDDSGTSVEAALKGTGPPAYPESTWHDVRNRVLNVDHRIFLVLDEPVGSRDILRIEGPNGINFVLPYSDRYLETPAIQLNQVGYSPRATSRWAYVSYWLGDGGPLDLSSFPATAQVLDEPTDFMQLRQALVDQQALPITARTSADVDSGSDVKQIDLSTVGAKDDGYYRIRIPGVGVSWRTTVSEIAVFKAFYVLARGLFLERWGGDLAAEFTDWSRPVDHPYVYIPDPENLNYFTESPRSGQEAYCEAARDAALTDPSRAIALAGGYHDAGDFDQRPMHVRIPQFLLRLYEANPSAFTDQQLTIPESGNGIPDILDEALWGIGAWEAFQNMDAGGCVRLGAETYMHPPFSLAHLEDLPYVTYGCHDNITARAAGLFAQAARLVEPFDATRAAGLRTKAELAYVDVSTGTADSEFMLYATSELYRLTGEASYRNDFLIYWNDWNKGLVSNWIPLGYDVDGATGVGAFPGFVIGLLNDPQIAAADLPLRNQFITTLDNRVDELRNQFDGLAHRNPRPAGYLLGYGQATIPMKYLYGMSARLEMGGLDTVAQQELFDYLSLAADYTLGANPNGLVYISGLGTRRVFNPLWGESIAFYRSGLGHMPGFPVDGPAAWIPWYSSSMGLAFHPIFDNIPQALQWADVDPVAPWTESAVWEAHAPLIHLLGMLIADNMIPPTSWQPSAVPGGGADHANPLPF